MQRYDMTFPSAVLADCVMKSANLCKCNVMVLSCNEKQQLARVSVTELTYDNLKKQFEGIHDIYTIAACDLFEIMSGSTYLAEGRDESVLSGNSSTRGCFNNYRNGNSSNMQ